MYSKCTDCRIKCITPNDPYYQNSICVHKITFDKKKMMVSKFV